MSKYTIVAAVNLFLGTAQAFISIAILFFTLPKLMGLYSEFDANPPSYMSAYIGLSFILLIALANFFIGLKLFSKSEEDKSKYLKYGILLIAITIILSGLFMIIANLSVILPIYNLTSEF